MRNVLPLTFAITLFSTAFTGVSHAAPPTESGGDAYDQARAAEERLDYRAVLASATKALEQSNTHERLVDLYRLLGTANGALGKNDDAIDAFTKLLAIDPDHRLPRGLSPKITRPFKEAGGYWMDRPGGLAVVPDLPRDVPGAKPVAISVKVVDPLQMAASVRLSYRRAGGDPGYTKVETPTASSISLSATPGAVTLTIPADQVPLTRGDYNLELFLTALSASGSELRLAGDADHPLTINVRAPHELEPMVGLNGNGNNTLVATPPPKKKNPILTKWWFWTAVGGVVVVGAALGGGLGAYYSRDTQHVDVNFTSK